jgi:hypothetical protein
MSMTYTQLKDNIADITENTFTDDQYKLFTQVAEENILQAVKIPALRRTDTSLALTSGTTTRTLPSDYLYTHSVAVKTAANKVKYLIPKENNFLFEAYPDDTVTGEPKYYAQFTADTIAVGPSPDSNYSLVITYGRYPESLVDADAATPGSLTWLSENASAVLLNGALVEAARFMKAEQDIVANYQQLYALSLQVFKQENDTRAYTDDYRTSGLVG